MKKTKLSRRKKKINKTSSEKEKRKCEKVSSQEEKRIAIKQSFQEEKKGKTQIVVTYLVIGWGLEGGERHRHPSN
jgi:hypothetical protein